MGFISVDSLAPRKPHKPEIETLEIGGYVMLDQTSYIG